MTNVKKIALVVAATGGLLFAGVGAASAGEHKGGGDYFPIISNFEELDWEDSPFCGIQIKTEDSKQKVSCPVAHLEDSDENDVLIVTD
jgi:hypothetical protein